MTLGELIRALEEHPEDMEVRFAAVEGKYGSIEEGPPGRFCSYRGDYAQLALERGEGFVYDEPAEHMEERGWRRNDTVAKLLEAAKAAVGATFEGYKGGEFTMDEDSPIYLVDNDSRASSIALSGVSQVGGVPGKSKPFVRLEGIDIGEYT